MVSHANEFISNSLSRVPNCQQFIFVFLPFSMTLVHAFTSAISIMRTTEERACNDNNLAHVLR